MSAAVARELERADKEQNIKLSRRDRDQGPLVGAAPPPGQPLGSAEPDLWRRGGAQAGGGA
ncbi:hypothetical protein BZL29_7826 [Mycobacterium kansasii]|uniref:Uncharacterized protein n=1 Tax=Mycobacterium kansasii TaxID=1768 RepID=A0A1V3WF59_MYCKA|nr:hypothetical protein BZL29_7826 [Mycobacterium kansasii]